MKVPAAPTLLIVGSLDTQVIELNRWAYERIKAPKELVIVAGASHLFEEPGTRHEVQHHAMRWFLYHLAGMEALEMAMFGSRFEPLFEDRRDAGRQLAAALTRYQQSRPVVLALPRGGVPVGFEVAKALAAPFDVLLVRKIGAPGHAELGLGAVVDGAEPQLVLNEEIVRRIRPPPGYIDEEMRRQLGEIERRRRLYLDDRPPVRVEGRTTIVVDDGIATGGTVRAALRGLCRIRPARLVLAVPVAPADSLDELAAECDDIICLATPEPFFAVGPHYRNFTQTEDDEVIRLLADARQWSTAEASAK